MPHYEQDDYVQEHMDGDAVWANIVASWRVRSGAHGQQLLIDLHDGWIFDSERWAGRGDVPVRLLAALRKANDPRSEARTT